ncbi:MAG TPA: DUF1707 domain-containing protein [Micromonosporaceae bacterium]|nr:DUF1707 domain-containing protein [Micromonosporaceae bacterium]
MDERVGHEQRTKVLDLLSKALAEGYLELPEYEERMTAVTSAKTASELTRQLADLPLPFQWDPRQHRVSALQMQAVARGVENNSAKTRSTAGLILGAVSIPMCFGLGAGLIFGIAAILLVRPGLKAPATQGTAVTGLILGCVGIVLSLMFIMFGVVGSLSPATEP